MVEVTFTQKVMDFANVFKAFIGASYLTMPFAFNQSGMVFGIILLIVVGWLTDHCCCKMVRCKSIIISRLMAQLEVKLNKGLLPQEEAELFASGQLRSRWEKNMTLSHIAKYAYGKKAQWVVSLCLFISQFGFCTGYFIFIGNTLRELLNYSNGNGTHVNKTDSTPDISNVSGGKIPLIYLVMFPLPIFLLSALLRSVRKIGWISAVATVTVMFGFFTIVVLLCEGFTLNHNIYYVRFYTLPIVFGMLTCAFEGIGTVIPIESSMVGNRHNYQLYMHTALALMVLILSSFGVIGYLRYGEDVKQIIIQDIPFSIFVSVINCALIINVLCTYPLQVFPVNEIAEFVLFRKTSSDLYDQRDSDTHKIRLTNSPEGDDINDLLAELTDTPEQFLENNDRNFQYVRLEQETGPSINYGSCDPSTGPSSSLNYNGSSGVYTKKEERMIRIIHGSKITAAGWKRNLVRVILVLLQLSLAVAMREKYAYLNAFIGAIGSSFLAYILPAATYYKLTKGTEDRKCYGLGDILIMIFGLVGSLTSFTSTLMEVI